METKLNFKNYFVPGDVLGLSYKNKGLTYFFEGLCIAIRGKNFKTLNATFILRNVLSDVGIELTCSFFYNRAFSAKVNKYKRKQLMYVKSKLFYIRHKLNKKSRVTS